ncbi:unnamed protein product [Rotaria sp. Silwood1]|nr:unnamed protein product [Rotaria sp. Silwood1]
MITTSTNNYTFTNTAENLIHVEDIQHIDLSYIEEHEDLPEKSADLRPINKEQNHLAIFTLVGHNEIPITTTTCVGDKNSIKYTSTETSQLLTSIITN